MLHKTSDSVEPAGGSHRLPSWEFSWHTGGRFGTWGSWHEVTSLLELTGPRELSPPPPTIARILVGISGALACSSSFCSSLQLWFLKKKKKIRPWVESLWLASPWAGGEERNRVTSGFPCALTILNFTWESPAGADTRNGPIQENREHRGKLPGAHGSCSEAVPQGYSLERWLPFLLGARKQKPTDVASALLMLDPKTDTKWMEDLEQVQMAAAGDRNSWPRCHQCRCNTKNGKGINQTLSKWKTFIGTASREAKMAHRRRDFLIRLFDKKLLSKILEDSCIALSVSQW